MRVHKVNKPPVEENAPKVCEAPFVDAKKLQETRAQLKVKARVGLVVVVLLHT